ncbi:MAG: hypothetical protein LAO51_02545 [Acidobacteriia bacterium]|nr:hypothetical protein [Terriglobia bacterium]
MKAFFGTFLVGAVVLSAGVAAAVELPAAEANLPEVLQGYRAIAPAPEGVAVRVRAGRIGHMEIHLDEGAVYPLKGAGGDVLGFYFDGHGHYAYKPEAPLDQQTFETNLSRYAPTLRPANHEVGDLFERLVVFFAAPTLPELWETGTGTAKPIEPASRAAFDRIWKRVTEGSYLEFDHLACEARMNGGKLQYVYAEIEGEKETLGYTLDRMRGFDETLTTFAKYQGTDVRFTRTLSRLAISREGEGSFVWTLKDAHLDVATDDNRKGTIDSELTFEAVRGNLRVGPLSLVNGRDPYSYNWASEKNRLRVLKVVDASGADVPFSHRYDELLVQLPHPLAKGERIVLRFSTEGAIFTGFGGETIDNYFDLFGASWFPRPFGWDQGLYTFTLKVKTRKPYYPLASGTTTAFREDGDHYALESSSTVPVEQPAVFAGKYKNHEEKADGLTIRLHSYAMANKYVVEVLPGLARELIRYYRDHLGPYPFDELDVVEVPEYWFGMAPSGMILLPTQAYKPRQDWLAAYLTRGAPRVVAHEIAHQWFGHKLVPASLEENWLSESFAEYLAGLAMGAGETDERRVVGFKTMFAEWRMYTARDCPDLPLKAANSMGGPDGDRDRWCLLYNRGPLVLHMLRTMVGEEKFFAILRRYLEKANFGPATTEDLKAVASEVLKVDLGWFFDEWYGEGGIPTIHVEQKVEPGAGGGFVFSGRLEQPEGPAFKRIFVPFVLDYPGGTREAKVVFQDKPVKEFRYELREKPRKVTVDPSENNLAVYR